MYDTSAYWQAQLMNWGPKILIAILILVATWIVARAVKWVIQKAIDRTPALRRHMTGAPDETVGHQLGTIAKLIIWLVGIMAALQFLGFAQILAPINELVTEIFAFLPRCATQPFAPCRWRSIWARSRGKGRPGRSPTRLRVNRERRRCPWPQCIERARWGRRGRCLRPRRG